MLIRGTVDGLYHIIVNLVLNAVTALPAAGEITIATQVMNEGLELTVSDTGTGMDQDTQQRIFEPFFTIKTQMGSGLGLSTVHNTVTNWGGRIAVESAPGQGTTFTLLLPAWLESEPPTAAVAAEMPPRPDRRTGPNPAGGG